jgi:hypothetical protein
VAVDVAVNVPVNVPVNVALDRGRRPSATFAAHVADNVTVAETRPPSVTFAATASARFGRHSFGIVTGCVQDAPGPRKGPQAQL